MKIFGISILVLFLNGCATAVAIVDVTNEESVSSLFV